nr:reverse transcriptase domain-containing protein [Tanacetum cinerariifolium]
MRTRSSSNLIVESFTIPKRRNRRRSKQIVKSELRNIVETPLANMEDTRTMSELLQAPTEGYKDAIVIPAITAENFELKVGLLSLNVPHDAIKLMLFPFYLEGAARTWLEKEPPRSIHTWEDLISKFVNYLFPPSKTTNLKNDITNFQQRFDETFSEAWVCFKDLLRKFPHHGFSELHQIDTFYNSLTQSDQYSLNATASGNLLNRTPRDALTSIENKSKVRISRNKLVVTKVNTTTSSSSPSPDITALTEIVKELVLMNKANQQASVKAVEETCVTCGGPHPYYECLATGGNTFDACAATRTYNQGVVFLMMKPQFYLLFLLSQKEVKRKTKATKDKVKATSSKSTAHVQPLVVQVPTSKPVVAPKPNPKPSITYPSRLNDQKLREKTNSQMLKFFQIFQRLHFYLRFADALLHIPKFASTFKSLLSNKEKLYELKNTPLSENCSAVLLKKLPKKLRYPGRFIIPCDFQGLESCMALADLGASINFIPLSIWKKLSLPNLTPTRMTLKLATRSFAYLAGIAEDVFVQVGKFTFPADFIVVDYDVDPRVLLILERPLLRTAMLYLTPFKTSDSLLEEFADELNLLDPFTSGNKDDNFDFRADLREIKYLLNKDPSTESNIKTIDPILEKFIDEPTLDYLPTPGDDDDDLFDLKSDNDERKKLLYGDCYKDTDSEKDKNKDSKTKSLVVEAHIVESNDLLPQLHDNDSTLSEESSESSKISSLSSSSFRNKDKVFNPGILILGRIQILKDESKDKDLILEERNFLSISSDKELLFFLELTVIET